MRPKRPRKAKKPRGVVKTAATPLFVVVGDLASLEALRKDPTTTFCPTKFLQSSDSKMCAATYGHALLVRAFLKGPSKKVGTTYEESQWELNSGALVRGVKVAAHEKLVSLFDGNKEKEAAV